MSDPLITGGYVMIARKIRKSSLWLSLKSAHRLVMLEILLQAQWQDVEVVRNGEVIPLKRGQLATSYQQLIDDIGDKDITIKIVRTAIDKMERGKFLAKDEAVQKAKKGLLLTVDKYGFYQDAENYKGSVEGSEKGKAKAEEGQSEGRARAINKNINNLEEGEEGLKPIVDSDECDLSFQKFWNAYPTKGSNKKMTLQKWATLWKNKKINLQEMLDGVSRYISFQNHHGYSICAAQVFLNQERWRDEWIIEEQQRSAPKGFSRPNSGTSGKVSIPIAQNSGGTPPTEEEYQEMMRMAAELQASKEGQRA